MHTEEFVLIPRQMYANEQPQIAQLLNNKNVREKAKHISLLQRSKSPPAPITQQDTQQQTDNILENVKDELNETRDDKIDIKVSTEIRERVLRHIKHLDRKKFEKASIKIEKNRRVRISIAGSDIKTNGNKSSTGILIADFLYDLQQTTSKLSLEHYKVLTFLDISSQLTCNTYAKKFLALSLNEKLQLFEDEPENEESGVSRTEESNASGDDEGSFEDAKDEIQPSSSWTNYFLSR